MNRNTILSILTVFIAFSSYAVPKKLPVPRYVTIKFNEVNARTGPTEDCPIEWVFIKKGEPVEIINISLTQTLNRTIITSLTTVMVLVALFYKGGALIHGFATALLFGVVVGTYSSVYIASSVALALGISKEDLMPPEVEKEGADQPDHELLP